MSRFTDDNAAYADNWRMILLVDAGIGWALVLVGLILGNAFGLVLVGGGVAYLVIGCAGHDAGSDSGPSAASTDAQTEPQASSSSGTTMSHRSPHSEHR